MNTPTKTALRSGKTTLKAYGLKDLSGLDGNAPGTFEAIVAVFGNVDYGNDRIVAGAFTNSLARWSASGDPIPVIFSHQWDNLDAHIGDVLEAKELAPGDPLLPPELAMNGGLWTKFRLEMDEDFASRVAKRLEKRTIREFSFAYDVYEERTASDGANELVEIDVIEVGPTLKGMNPATALLARARKALGEKADGLTDEQVLERVTIPGEPAVEAKAWVTLTGSAEERQEAAYAAAFAWAADGNIGAGGFYTCYLEATFDDRVVVMVEGWDDPYGEGEFYELDLAFDGETATVDNPRAVALEATTVAKSRAMKHRARAGSATGEKRAATVTGADDPGKVKDNGAPAPEDPGPRTGSEGDQAPSSVARAAVDLALLEAGLDPTDPTP